MHPTIAHHLARARIDDFHAAAAADRRLLEARRHDTTPVAEARAFGSRWSQRPDPTGLVRRLLARLNTVVAP
jgi:hypothetical protein